MMNAQMGLETIANEQLIVISRGLESHRVLPVADALLAGGVRVLEITLNTIGAEEMIAHLVEHVGERMFIGAGTVTNVAEARNALTCGAQFLVTPNTEEAVIHLAIESGVPIYPGAYTPTEIIRAWQAGATAVKIFPTGTRGLEFIRELQGPLGHIPMIALGGIDATNVTSYIKLGCYAVGVGSSVLQREAIVRGDYDEITNRAKALVDAIAMSKNGENDLLNLQ